MKRSPLTRRDRDDIQEILERRANEVAGFLREYEKQPVWYGSVELALTREIDRLRDLAHKVANKDKDTQ